MTVDFDRLRPRLAELCARYGISELSVFGSVVREDDHPDSDVDLLYVWDTEADPSWHALWQLRQELASLLGRPIDLVPKESLHWVVRDRVLADARVVYAA